MLYSTICHKALKMDKMSVWIVQNVSVADICNCVFVLLPTLITQFSGRWVLGETLCYLFAEIRYLFFIANIFLLTILSLNKLIRCIYPLRNMSPTRKQRYMVTMVSVIFCVIPVCWWLYLWATDQHWIAVHSWYVGAFGICQPLLRPNSSMMRKAMETVNFVFFLILDCLMCTIMTVTNTILLIYAIKMTNRPVVKKNVIMVIAMCVIFIITFLPTPLIDMIDYWPIHYLPIHVEVAYSVGFISVWINPWIHFAINKKFQKFAMNRILFWRRREAILSNNIQQAQTAL